MRACRSTGASGDERLCGRLPLPRAARQSLPARPAGEVPRICARRPLDDREPAHAHGRLPARVRRRLAVAVRAGRPLSALPVERPRSVDVLRCRCAVGDAVDAVRAPLFLGTPPRWTDFVYLVAECLLSLALGAWVFTRIDDQIAIEV